LQPFDATRLPATTRAPLHRNKNADTQIYYSGRNNSGNKIISQSKPGLASRSGLRNAPATTPLDEFKPVEAGTAPPPMTLPDHRKAFTDCANTGLDDRDACREVKRSNQAAGGRKLPIGNRAPTHQIITPTILTARKQ
jgi:hypothetical protein